MLLYTMQCSGKVSQETETHGSVGEPQTELGRMFQAEGQSKVIFQGRAMGVVLKELTAKEM